MQTGYTLFFRRVSTFGLRYYIYLTGRNQNNFKTNHKKLTVYTEWPNSKSFNHTSTSVSIVLRHTHNKEQRLRLRFRVDSARPDNVIYYLECKERKCLVRNVVVFTASFKCVSCDVSKRMRSANVCDGQGWCIIYVFRNKHLGFASLQQSFGRWFWFLSSCVWIELVGWNEYVIASWLVLGKERVEWNSHKVVGQLDYELMEYTVLWQLRFKFICNSL